MRDWMLRIFLVSGAALLLSACGDSSSGGGGSAGEDLPGEDMPRGDVEEDAVEEDMPDMPGGGFLVINEVAAAGDPDDWFELYNGTGARIDLSGYVFSDDPETQTNKASFPEGASIGPGAYLKIQFEGDYPGFGLGGGEALGVFDASGEKVDSVDWSDGESPEGTSFGRIPDGTGPLKTLFYPTPGAENQDNAGGSACGDATKEGEEECDDGNREPNDGCNERCEEEFCGNGIREGEEQCDDGNQVSGDGCDACVLPQSPGELVINEIAASPETGSDWIELHNKGGSAIALLGWSLNDEDQDESRKFVFEEEQSLDAGGFWLLEKGGSGFDFGLGGADQVLLFNPDGALADSVSWTDGQSPPGASFGRSPDGSGAFETLFAPSPGAQNRTNAARSCGDEVLQSDEVCDGGNLDGYTCASLGLGGDGLACADDCASLDASACEPRTGVVINEVSSSDADTIELFNASEEAVDLSGWVLGDADFDTAERVYVIPEGTSVAPGAWVSFDRDDSRPFGLGSVDRVSLWNDQGDAMDSIAYRRGKAEVSWCRLPDGSGAFQVCAELTAGSENR